MESAHKFLDFILDFFFPRPTLTISIQNMSEEELVSKIPKAREIEDEEFRALFDYRNELARQAIWEIKYRRNEKLAAVFCKLFYEYIIDEIADTSLFFDFKNPILVPIPSSKKRLKERSYNQCEIVVKELARIDGGKNFILPKNNILEKIKDSPSQTSTINRTERLRNLKGCFSAVDSDKVVGANIILIDDVITTGATMSEAKTILRNVGAHRVIGFALAH